MKDVVCQNRRLTVVDRPEPVPGKGQVLVKVLRCGICGSDLHVRKHCDQWGEVMARSGYRALLRSEQQVVFGHEFSAEVLDYGRDCERAVKLATACGADGVVYPAAPLHTQIGPKLDTSRRPASAGVAGRHQREAAEASFALVAGLASDRQGCREASGASCL